MVEKFGKSWLFLNCLSRLGHITDRYHSSILIYTWKTARQYFNYLSSYVQKLNCAACCPWKVEVIIPRNIFD